MSISRVFFYYLKKDSTIWKFDNKLSKLARVSLSMYLPKTTCYVFNTLLVCSIGKSVRVPSLFDFHQFVIKRWIAENPAVLKKKSLIQNMLHGHVKRIIGILKCCSTEGVWWSWSIPHVNVHVSKCEHVLHDLDSPLINRYGRDNQNSKTLLMGFNGLKWNVRKEEGELFEVVDSVSSAKAFNSLFILQFHWITPIKSMIIFSHSSYLNAKLLVKVRWLDASCQHLRKVNYKSKK